MITINKLKKALQKDENLEIIKTNFFYLLSEFGKKSLNIYLKNKNLKFAKKDFINNFINNLKNKSVERQNEIIEILSKKIIFEETNINIKTGKIKDVDFYMPTSTNKPKNKPIGYSKDAYFNDLIEHENYEELNNLYGIRVIERDSNLLDGGRK